MEPGVPAIAPGTVERLDFDLDEHVHPGALPSKALGKAELGSDPFTCSCQNP